jgi:hypothetical protein
MASPVASPSGGVFIFPNSPGFSFLSLERSIITGGEIPGEQERWRQNQSGYDGEVPS